MITTKNPARYRELSEPFESTYEANAAIQKFYDAVELARTECGLPDVYVIVSVNVDYPKGEGKAFSTVHFGVAANGLPLTAMAFGREKRAHEEMVAGAIGAGGDYR